MAARRESGSLADRLRAQLHATRDRPVPHVSDMHSTDVERGTPAAVLIALTDRAAPGLILTLRAETLRRHAGQVAFPGGRIDPGDADAVAAALREAQEEIALPPACVAVVGHLATYRTITGFDIVPVVGVVAPDLALVAHDREVAAVFEVPLSHLLGPANRTERTIVIEGRDRRYIETIWHDGTVPRRIWGATAAIIANLGERLRADAA